MTTLLTLPGSLRPPPVVRSLDLRGPYDLREVAGMSFGHRDEQSFDGVMRLACCLDGGYERAVGVELRQHEDTLELTIHSEAPALTEEELAAVTRQVARVVSADLCSPGILALESLDLVLQLHLPSHRVRQLHAHLAELTFELFGVRRGR